MAHALLHLACNHLLPEERLHTMLNAMARSSTPWTGWFTAGTCLEQQHRRLSEHHAPRATGYPSPPLSDYLIIPLPNKEELMRKIRWACALLLAVATASTSAKAPIDGLYFGTQAGWSKLDIDADLTGSYSDNGWILGAYMGLGNATTRINA